MGTQANTYIDVILEAPTRAALASWFNDPERELQRIWVKPGTEGIDSSKWNNFNDTYTVSKELTVGPPGPARSLFLIRMIKIDYDAMIAANPPSNAVNIVQTVDGFAPLTFVDDENPTEAELNANNIWYQSSLDNAKRDKIREYYPYDTGEDDGQGGTIKTTLQFGSFTEREKGFKGAGEV